MRLLLGSTAILAALFLAPLASAALAATTPVHPAEPAAAATPILHPAVLEKATIASPAPVGDGAAPVNPASPTLWLKPLRPALAHLTLSNVSMSTAPTGTRGCLLFTVTAPAAGSDIVELLSLYNGNEVMADARIYESPVIYSLTQATIKSYRSSGNSVTLTLQEQAYSANSNGHVSSGC